MPKPLRRVVTGHDVDGKAVVIYAGASPQISNRPTGHQSILLWVTDRTPADNKGDADTGDQTIGIPPPTNGSVFRIVDFPPESETAAEEESGRLAESGATTGEGHPGMHKTDSIDYAIVMEGEIDMLLDDSEVRVKAGDVVVQRGTMHAWANRSDQVCRIAFILIDADPSP